MIREAALYYLLFETWLEKWTLEHSMFRGFNVCWSITPKTAVWILIDFCQTFWVYFTIIIQGGMDQYFCSRFFCLYSIEAMSQKYLKTKYIIFSKLYHKECNGRYNNNYYLEDIFIIIYTCFLYTLNSIWKHISITFV